MKPIKLTMTGFESYCEKTTIDFEKLNNSGIYLISGDTGSGKTTIFDAITFALYGEASGENRKEEMLRSDFADDQTPTEVELEFESNGKKYHIKRNPTYKRINKKGTGTTEEKSNAVLKFLSEEKVPVEGTKKVTNAVQEILKLQKEQFCKIAMIAQGAFQTMLLAGTEEKKKIFRELFDTSKYSILNDTLKTEKSNSQQNLETEKSKLKELFSILEIDENEQDYEELEQMKKTLIVGDDEIKILENLSKKIEENLKKIDLEYKKIQNEIKSNDIKIEKEKNRQLFIQQKEGTKIFLERKKKELDFLKVELDNAKENLSNKDKLVEKSTLIKESFPIYQKISEEESNLANLKQKILATTTQKTQSESEKIENDEKLKTEKENFEKLKNAGINKIKLQEELNQIEKKLEEINNLTDKISSFEKNQIEYENLVANFKQAEKTYTEIYQNYNEKRQLYNSEQAGILAQTLQEGFPCPVCGSTSHPNIAKKSQNAPTKQEVDKLEKESNEAKENSSEIAAKAKAAKAKTETFEEQIKIDTKKILSNFTFENLLDEIANLKKEISSEKDELNKIFSEKQTLLQNEQKNILEKEKIEKQIPILEAKSSELSKEILELEKQLASDNSTYKNSSDNLLEKKKNLEFSTYEQACDADKLLQQKISQLENDFYAANEKYNQCTDEISTKKGILENIENQLKTFPIQDLENLVSEKENQECKEKELLLQRDNLNSKKGTISSTILKIKEIAPKIPPLEAYNYMIQELYSITSGQTKDKISLETYVQIKFLDEITKHANLRLKVMTDNKYELVRRKEKTDGKSQYGLDFDIKDFYTGRERPVASLSGGEKFQASLALALGLADEIQKSSGGIKLDTMFIDEGFGSLDTDTLHKAMKALEDLSKNNKQIGIISHIAELEERISNKIKVTKDKISGKSSLVIIAD